MKNIQCQSHQHSTNFDKPLKMFKYLILIQPLGFMYGSSGGFLSPENLVGRSRAKFPPDAATLSGLFFSTNKVKSFTTHEDLNQELHVAGPFWTLEKNLMNFYVPIPRTKLVTQKKVDEWTLKDDQWERQLREEDFKDSYSWQRVNSWDYSAKKIKSNKDAAGASPWKFVSILHPKMKLEERHVKDEDGLFLEYAVQLPDDVYLAYLSTHELPEGWYRFGGENHVVEIKSIELPENHPIITLLKKDIKQAFALITPAIWGSNRLSYRHPQHPDFPASKLMLTDKAIPFRYRRGASDNPQDSKEYRVGGQLGRGRYAVGAGSVYVLEKPLNKSWWDWPEEWFPQEGFSLKKLGCGLCLPLTIQGLE